MTYPARNKGYCMICMRKLNPNIDNDTHCLECECNFDLRESMEIENDKDTN